MGKFSLEVQLGFNNWHEVFLTALTSIAYFVVFAGLPFLAGWWLGARGERLRHSVFMRALVLRLEAMPPDLLAIREFLDTFDGRDVKLVEALPSTSKTDESQSVRQPTRPSP